MTLSPEPAAEQTMVTYGRFAKAYARQTRQRDGVRHHLHRWRQLLPAGGRVLDVGCGPGFDAGLLQQAGYRACGLDLSRPMLLAGREAGVTVPLVQADLRRLPLESGRLDGIWACASLVHLPRPAWPAALAELRRIMRPLGLFYLSTKQGDGEAWRDTVAGRPAQRYFVYWQAAALDQLLAQSGFIIVDGWEEPGEADRWLVRFVRRQDSMAERSMRRHASSARA